MKKELLVTALAVVIISALILIPSETDATIFVDVSDEASFVEIMNQDGVNVRLQADLVFDLDTVALYDENPYEDEVDLYGDDVVLDLNGHSITSTNLGLGFVGKNVIVKNGTINATQEPGYRTGYVSYPVCIWGEAEVTFENITTLGGIAAYDDSTLTIRDCSIHGTNYYALWSEAHIIVESGDIHKDLAGNANYIVGIREDGGDSIVINGGYFGSTTDAGIALGSPYLPPVINGGSFEKDPSAYIGPTMEVTVGSDSLYYVSEFVEPESGSIVSEYNNVSADLSDTKDIKVEIPLGTISIIGSDTLNDIRVSMELKTFSEAPSAIASFEINIVTETDYVADITVNATIPYGHEALVYYIDDSGNLIPVKVVSYTSTTVTFRTTHTTPFVVMSEEIAETPTTPAGDEDEDYPFPPGQGPNQGSNATTTKKSSDDTTKVIAAAAAVVVIMLAAVALMVNRNN